MIEMDLQRGQMALVVGGTLRGCGDNVPVGSVVAYYGEHGELLPAPEEGLAVTFYPAFEVSSNPIGNKSVENLEKEGIECIRGEIESKEKLLTDAGASEVWCMYRKRPFSLPMNRGRGKTKGLVVSCHVAMFGTTP